MAGLIPLRIVASRTEAVLYAQVSELTGTTSGLSVAQGDIPNEERSCRFKLFPPCPLRAVPARSARSACRPRPNFPHQLPCRHRLHQHGRASCVDAPCRHVRFVSPRERNGHARRSPERAQLGKRVKTIAVRQTEIEQQHIHRIRRCGRNRRRDRGADRNPKPTLFEEQPHRAADELIVFGDQYVSRRARHAQRAG